MPILDVEVVVFGDDTTEGLSALLADAAAAVFQSPPGNTWVRLRELRSENYAENGGGPPQGTRPVFVRVLLATLPAQSELATQAAALAAAVARACGGTADDVHVVYEPPAAGRIAFGGNLLKG